MMRKITLVIKSCIETKHRYKIKAKKNEEEGRLYSIYIYGVPFMYQSLGFTLGNLYHMQMHG